MTDNPDQMPDIVVLEKEAMEVEERIEQIHRILTRLIKALPAVLIGNALAIVAIAYFLSPITACKLLFVEVTLTLSVFCLLVVLFNRVIQNELIHLEVLAIQGQDEARAGMQQGRRALTMLNKKVEETFHPKDDTMHELYHNLIPMVQLYINKEKNLLRWGHLSWRLANNLISIFNSKK